MPSPLDGQIAKAIHAGFRGKLKKGIVRREAPGTGRDRHGDRNPGVVRRYPFEGIRENYDAAYRERAGIPETDVQILVITRSCAIEPKQDDQIFIQNRWHQVRRVSDSDPAGATITLQAFEIQARPTP